MAWIFSALLALAAVAAAPAAPGEYGEHGWKPGQRWARCGVVEVVDQRGEPVPEAYVMHHRVDPSSNRDPMGGEAWRTNRRGRVCAPRLLEAGYLEVHAPPRVGGWCAGFLRRRYAGWRASSGAEPVTRLSLSIRRLRRAAIRGRVLSAEGQSVAGASILIEQFLPTGTECTESDVEHWFQTAANGTFRLPAIPHGEAKLRIEHHDFATRVVSVTVPSPPKEVVLERGARWTGRVVGPDAVGMEDCALTLRTPDGIEVSGRCSPSGFDLRSVPAGDAVVKVRFAGEQHPTLSPGRVLLIPVHLAPNEQRQQDLVWPAGASISGRVTTEAGNPASGARVMAMSTDKDRVAAEGTIEVVAGADGRFAFHHLSPGPWLLLADRRAPQQTKTEVAAGSDDVHLVVPATK